MKAKIVLIFIAVLAIAIIMLSRLNSTAVHSSKTLAVGSVRPVQSVESEFPAIPVAAEKPFEDTAPDKLDLPESLLRPSSSLFEPDKLLTMHIDRSLSGDIDSAHIVSEVIRFCNRMPATQANYERGMAMDTIPEDRKNLMRLHFPLCQEARKNHRDVFENQSAHLSNELARQHPLHRMIFKIMPLEERSALVRHQFVLGFEHPFLKGETLRHAAMMFTAHYPENEDMFLRRAVELLACKYEKFCDQPFLVGLYKMEYPPAKYNQLVELAVRIDSGISRGDLSLLRL